jgi:hypothetical protein
VRHDRNDCRPIAHPVRFEGLRRPAAKRSSLKRPRFARRRQSTS